MTAEAGEEEAAADAGNRDRRSRHAGDRQDRTRVYPSIAGSSEKKQPKQLLDKF